MIAAVRQVSDSIRAAKLTLKPTKCTFGASGWTSSELPYLKVWYEQDRKYRHSRNPRMHTRCAVFLGLTYYFRHFIVNYARVATPLTQLTGRDVAYERSEAQKKSFNTLRKLLSDAPVLGMFNPKTAVT